MIGKRAGRNLFEPPSYNAPAAAREALAALAGDIEAVVRFADAVLDLDASTRGGRQSPTPPASGTPVAR